ncbi:DNA polymerase III subunit chi [Glaciimonas sp. CA11.2]|uniref:DNA polymerase III subunit chi n=1 Tax=unclassified Glaciimonas TaxID=2644401 RepID=UPI002AB341FC|nr:MULTISPECIES: DNA polymerase III subunit chi [unclassified Glaciimonas]MDY7546862.1 DNA polymerase III subunit chi [Glaciimonas sp. CA11.2]MEB0012331.1 DNA polymerase III subunit chi [Glaciimonas sp. Cout2]MEB0080483.1 DNA polymerase III subunit chi [Glaciimonas sp. Gout2]MEB0165297.1 DNA polymerase III subunit chi [Glaciimonas sp. CA11.2]
MTQIDFHTNIPDKFLYTCRLVRKARMAQCQIVILTSNAEDLATMDRTLWTFSEHDFVPHVVANDPLAQQTPVILTDDETIVLPHHQVLINLSGNTPSHFARFERMFEIVTLNETDKNNSRERYRFYQQRGYQLSHSIAANA